MFSMHTAHLANVSKSVTKNATFPRTGGLPCLITHSCMSAASPTVVGGLIFCISAPPHLGCLFPLFHGVYTYSMQHLLRDNWRSSLALIVVICTSKAPTFAQATSVAMAWHFRTFLVAAGTQLVNLEKY